MKNVNEIYDAELDGIDQVWQSDHIKAMWTALDYSQTPIAEDNGCGTVWVYTFKESEKPLFQCVSDDIFNQIKIVLI